MVEVEHNRAKVISINLHDRMKMDMVKEGLLTKEELKVAEMTAVREKAPLGKTLVKLNFVKEEELTRFIGDKTHIPYINIKSYALDRRTIELVPESIARRYMVIPVFMLEGVLTVAMSDPLDIISIDDISKVAGCKIEPVIASQESIGLAIDQWYGIGEARKELLEELVDDIEVKELMTGLKDGDEISGILEAKEASEPPIVKLVNSFIAQGMIEGASDIHLEPKRDYMLVRFRIDGFLYERQRFSIRLVSSIVSRIKIMSGLDISKKMTPQDGRIGLVIRDRSIDVRTSVYPAMFGENVVLRILDKTKRVPTLSALGFSELNMELFKKMLKAQKGLILATGPTGSGKTTTIYSAIEEMQAGEKNIVTIEDPVEYEIDGIVQSQINLNTGITFATALRSILRQDPDVIYVGEIRDLETAEIAVRSALTGHLVISTLHTNDAVGSIPRFLDLGIEKSLVASVLNCSFAQRLVRKLCQRCKKEYEPDDNMLINLKLPPSTKFYRADGCEHCSAIGYMGRIGIFEILVLNKDIRKLVAQGASEDEILDAAKSQGMKTLFEDGLEKVLKGITSIDEVNRVTEEE